jgi:hypothetical protein
VHDCYFLLTPPGKAGEESVSCKPVFLELREDPFTSEASPPALPTCHSVTRQMQIALSNCIHLCLLHGTLEHRQLIAEAGFLGRPNYSPSWWVDVVSLLFQLTDCSSTLRFWHHWLCQVTWFLSCGSLSSLGLLENETFCWLGLRFSPKAIPWVRLKLLCGSQPVQGAFPRDLHILNDLTLFDGSVLPTF